MTSSILENCNSIESVVELINDGGTSMYSSEEIAGQYAYDAALENGYGMEQSDFEAQLDFLVEAGAEFDFSNALTEASTIKKG